MTKLLRPPFYSLLFFCYTLSCYSQEQVDASYYNTFDQAIGIENTNLYQGIEYKTTFRTSVDKTQFYKKNDFIEGAVQYDGQWFYDLDLKYDIYEDRLMLKLGASSGDGTLILLNNLVDGFEIGGDNFVNIGKEEAPDLEGHGFYKSSLKNTLLEISLFKKLVKKQLKKKDQKSVYYEFVDGSNKYVLYHKGKYSPFNTKGEAIKLFPKFKKDITKFYSQANRLRRSNLDNFQVSLVRRIEVLLSTMTNKSLQ